VPFITQILVRNERCTSTSP